MNLDLLQHISASLLLTNHQLEIMWLNESVKKFNNFQIGGNLFTVFPSHQKLFFLMLKELNTQLHTSSTLSSHNNIYQLIAQPFSKADDLILWDISLLPQQDSLKKDDPVPDLSSHMPLFLQSCKNDIFHIFNSLFPLSLPQTGPVHIIDNISKHCYHLYHNVINATICSSNVQPLESCEVELISISHYLTMIVEDVNRLLGPDRSKMTLHFAGSNLFVKLDVEKFQIALFNLIANAYEASLQEGAVEIFVTQQSNRCIIRINDEGVGFDPTKSSAVFEPYYSLKPPISPHHVQSKHLGLGLTAAKMIIQQHNGTILISSRPNAGTKVMIVLPIEPVDTNQKIVKNNIKQVSNRLSYLYVFLSEACDFPGF